MEDGRLPDSAATAPIVMGRSGFDIKPTLTGTLAVTILPAQEVPS
jgi:hypothetical protein